jgi:hypothetical protein
LSKNFLPPTYYQKLGYPTPWFQPKSKKRPDRPRHLWGDYLVQQVERHLDPRQWHARRGGAPGGESPFWLGLTMPRRTTVSCLDLDAKPYLLGYYRLGEQCPPRPVVYLPLGHLRKLRLVYDHFPGRVWCLSSATLGLHAWRKYPGPVDALQLHARTKDELRRLGLGAVEVHPMPGRCLRRPFGRDYATLTPAGPEACWQGQVEYFESVAHTPPFERIAATLLAEVKELWRLWEECGDATRKGLSPRQVVAQHRHHLEEAEAWVGRGCPSEGRPLHGPGSHQGLADGRPAQTERAAAVLRARQAQQLERWLGAGCPPQDPAAPCLLVTPPPDQKPAEPAGQPPPRKSRPAPADGRPGFDLGELRNGRWAKGLAEVAANGLPCGGSLHAVCYEMAKWLYWVELYDRPDREQLTFRLLSGFARAKHNGHCRRVNGGTGPPWSTTWPTPSGRPGSSTPPTAPRAWSCSPGCGRSANRGGTGTSSTWPPSWPARSRSLPPLFFLPAYFYVYQVWGGQGEAVPGPGAAYSGTRQPQPVRVGQSGPPASGALRGKVPHFARELPGEAVGPGVGHPQDGLKVPSQSPHPQR